ncbi:MAG TPA: TIM-barrel domain-containing protein [Acidobacteriaceae bacterium]|jgi:alpha-D-xyloside xylohydrolase
MSGKTNQLTRRGLAKGLAMAGVAAGIPDLVAAQGAPAHASVSASSTWKELYPGVWRATLGSPESFTPVSSRLVDPKVEAFKLLPEVKAAPLPALQGQITNRGCTVQLPLREHELVYGLGLQLLSFGQRGRKKVMRVNADPKVDNGDSHAPVPFYVTTKGIGVLVDTARYATFYLGDARLKPERSVALEGGASPDPTYTHNIRDDDAGSIAVEVPRAAGVDVYLFAGPTMLDAVRRYNLFSGGGVVPPEWGLGFWYRFDARSTQETALEFGKEFRDRKIPCDVMGLEPGWQTHAYSCTFAWEKSRFPDPAGFIHQAQRMGYKVNLWEHAFTHPASPLFNDLKACSGDYGVWGGLVPDFAGAQAREAFGDYHGKTLIDAGISGFKLDECDNSDYTGGWSFPELSRFPSGVDGEQMHNVFGLRYQKTLWDQFLKRRQSTYGLVRSSGALAAPYPFVLYSDLYNHRDFIRALVNSGFSGLLWCPEVRDAASKEDLLRRLQSVVFSPLAMVNGWYIKNPPWRQLDRKLNNAGQMMEGWEETEARCREIIGWRMALVPYLTAAFERYAADGTPPFRALVLDAPDEAALAKVDDQYMIGDRMMVAPLFAGEARRKVTIPAGAGWHDFWTGAAVAAGSTLTLEASATEHIPVYVRTGSIVPWAEVGPHAGSPESRRLTARVYGDGSLPFELHRAGKAMRLTWQGSRGDVNDAGEYSVSWKQMGQS